VPDVKDAMGACDCGLIASTASEAICRVGLEFMALGIPVIASHFHAIPDIVKHQENGLLFEVGSDANLSQAMELFLSYQDKWRAMGDKGRVMVEETFHLQQMGNCSLDFYSQLMESRGGKE
jgi:glycosyltransferase involved in cell wall biosynthesis